MPGVLTKYHRDNFSQRKLVPFKFQLVPFLKFPDDKKIKKHKRNRNQQCVEAVEDAAVAGEDVTGIFDADAAFQHGFHQVAKRTGGDDDY